MVNVKGYICFYADYMANDHVSVSDEIFLELDSVYASLESGILEYPSNFLGITDETGYTIQFYVNDDYSIDVDIPVPEQEGSLTRVMDKSECIALIHKAGRFLKDLQIEQLEFKKW